MTLDCIQKSQSNNHKMGEKCEKTNNISVGNRYNKIHGNHGFLKGKSSQIHIVGMGKKVQLHFSLTKEQALFPHLIVEICGNVDFSESINGIIRIQSAQHKVIYLTAVS